MVPNRDPFQVLGLSQDASEAEVKKAYHKLALKFHPDRQNNKENQQKAADKFAAINEAYETLSDPVKRYDYRQKQEQKTGSSSGAATTTNRDRHRSAPPPPSTSSPTATQYGTPSGGSSYAKTNPRTEFTSSRTSGNNKQHESTRSGFPASPGNLRRKAVPRASVRMTSPPQQASPSWRKTRGVRVDARQMPQAPISAPVHRRGLSSTVHMDGSVRNMPPQPPLSGGSGRARRTVGGCPMMSNTNHRTMPSQPPLSGGGGGGGGRRKAGLRMSQMPQAPLSAGTNSKKKTMKRHSQMPQAPMSAGNNTRRGLSSAQSSRRVPDIPLPVMNTNKGRFVRQSVRVQANSSPSPSPRSQSPKHAFQQQHDDWNNHHHGSAPLYCEPARHSGGAAPRRNSLDGTGRKSNKPRRHASTDERSLDGTTRKKKSKQQPPRQVSHDSATMPATSRRPKRPVVMETVTTTKTTTTRRGKTLSPPPPTARKSLFGFGKKKKVQDDSQSTQTGRKKKKKKKKVKSLEGSERSVRSTKSARSLRKRRAQ